MSDTPSGTPGYQRFFAELKRREVFRVAAVYGAVGFVVLQVADLLAEGLALPDVVLRTATFLVLLGFPIALVLAWAYERTASGVRRTDPAETSEIEAIAAQPASKRWPSGLLALAGVIALVLGAWWVGRSTAPGDNMAAGTEGAAGDSGSDIVAESGGTAGTSGDAVLQLAYADLSEDGRPSIAVLPFVNMSADEEQQYFADGMTEELLNALAKIRELRVAGRTSSFAYRGQERDLREIGDELGVRYLVEGSVRKQGDRLRITAQLVDANDAFHLWSDQYDRTMDDVFAVQTEIAESIAEALEVSLGLGAEEVLVTPTSDLDAYDLYLAAQGRMRQRREGVEEAVRLYSAAVARDSGWAPAWAGLAQAEALVPYYEGDELSSADSAVWATSLARAERAARRALQLDATNAGAEVALANVIRDRWEWGAAETHYLRALEIDPDNAEAHQQYAEHLAQVGRLDEALRSARRSVALDPTAAIRVYVLAYILEINGRFAESIAAYERAIELDPELLRAHFGLINALLALGEIDRAEALERAEIMPRIAAKSGMSDEERAELDGETEAIFAAFRAEDGAALAAAMQPWQDPWLLAMIGDIDRALDALSSYVANAPGYGATWQTNLWTADWDGFRDDPRFREVLTRVNLEGVEPRRAAPEG
ncbi:MAG: tetratricopeptide repeat protein [marine benthic group bacterium]|nr:tetratricopeptide repeat protein [Gemmatimonadota bacterium]